MTVLVACLQVSAQTQESAQAEGKPAVRNSSKLQAAYQFSAIAHQIPVDYIHSFGRHGLLIGIRALVIKGGYRTVDDPKSSYGLSLGYEYEFASDTDRKIRPYLNYRFLYNPSLQIKTLSPMSTYNAQQQVVSAGIRFQQRSGLYTLIGIGGLLTHYIVTSGVGPDPKNRTNFDYTLQVGLGYRFARGHR